MDKEESNNHETTTMNVEKYRPMKQFLTQVLWLRAVTAVHT
jgi:hypothetical protein